MTATCTNSFLFPLHSRVKQTIIFFQTTNEKDQLKTDRYSGWTRSQVKASGIKLPKVHGTHKSLVTHVRPGKQKPLSSLPIHNIDKGQPTHPIPKPRIGQGRARLKRKVKMNQPMPLSQQTPVQPMVTHVPKTALSLPKSVTQSQVQPQHIPIPLI